MQPPEQEPFPTTPPERRASLERIRAVGQTFADGIAALRERVSKPSPEGDDIPSPVTDDREHRLALLEAAEARADSAVGEAVHLRTENGALRAAADRSTRLVDELRRELARVRKEITPAAEVVRIRVLLAEREKELAELADRLRAAEREVAEETRRRVALERVCIGLRSKAALAEERARDAGKLQDAVLAREEAETRLAEARAQVERLRVKAGAVGVLRERAEASERSERALREKTVAMERELEGRDALLQQGLVERRRLKEFVGRFEREVEEKERRIMKLRRALRRRQPLREGSDDETEVTVSVDKEVAAEEEDLGGWDQEFTAQSLESERLPAPQRPLEPGQAISFPEASPLMKEVEEQHAILQAAFDEPDRAAQDEEIDLAERVRRLEESLSAFRQTGNVPVE